MSLRRARIACVVTALALGPAAASERAVGADVTVNGSVTPGHLGIGAPRVRVSVARRHARVADTLHVPLTVVDTRGNGHGWRVAMTATAETGKGKRVRGIHVSVRGFSLNCNGCTRPVDKIAYPLALPLAKPTNVFRAARRSGMGIMHLNALLAVAGTPKPATGTLAIVVRLAQVSGP